MTEERERTADWSAEEWAGADDAQDASRPPREPDQAVGHLPEAPARRWVKTEWVGDQGDGAPAPLDPRDMPEGESGLSGDRHNPGEQHWRP